MKDRHIHLTEDNQLFKEIIKQIDNELKINPLQTILFLGFKFVFYLSLQVWAYYLIFQTQSPIWFVVNFVAYGLIGILFAFNFAHDFSHNTVFKSKFWNNLGFALIYTLLGAHAEAWKYRHVHSHHFAPNVKDYDSDLQITSLIRVEPTAPHFWFHQYQHFYAPFVYTTYSLFWVFVKDFYIYFWDKSYPKVKTWTYHLSFWAQKSFYLTYLLILPLLFSHQTWQIVFIGFLVMHLVQSLFLLFTFFMTHHVENLEYPSTNESGEIQTSWFRNQVMSSNDFYPFSAFANFIFGGFNNHIAHHLFPHIHHIYYPKLNQILYKALIDNNLQPHATTYWGGIKSHLRHLREMGRNDF
jgi:linoleoyl-CoA desaturase